MTDDERMDARLSAAGARWRERTDGDTLTTGLPDVDEEFIPRPPRRRTWFVAAAAAAVVALIAGLAIGLRGEPRHAAPPNGDLAGLQGVVWLLQGTPGTASTATLYIARNGTLVADDECRLIGGHATITGSRLDVRDLVVRYKSCTDQYGPGFYDQGTNVLRGPATYSIDAAGLTIARGGHSLRFVPAPQAVPPPSLDVPTLTDTNWVAPGGKTLRIDATTGDVTGTYCSGHTMLRFALHLDRCGLDGGSFTGAVSGAVLTLTSLPSRAPFPVKRRVLTFQWQPTSAVVDPAAITNHNWMLQAVTGEPASSGNLKIADGVATVDDGCRSFPAPATVTRGAFTLRIHPSAHPCSAAAGTVDGLLASDPAAWVIRDGRLIVYGGGSQAFALVYRAEPQAPATPVQGDWTLAKISSAGGALETPAATATLIIGANGAVSGTDGCRTFTGTVTTSGTTATFTLTLPALACSSGIEQSAGLFDRVLGTPVTFTVAAGALVLSSDEIGRLTFTGKPVGGQDPQLLTAHSWQITTITYGAGHFRNGAAAQDGGAQLSFTGQGYRIEHACYLRSGAAMLTSGLVTFRTWSIRDHSCPPPPAGSPRDEAAQAIDRILTGEVRWSVDGSVLTLSSTRGSLRAIGGVPSELTGSRWRLASTARGNSSRTAVGTVMLSFPSAKQLTVERCYTSTAQVEVGDSALVVVGLHTSIARPCPSGPPGTQQQNQIIDSVLAGEVMWSIVGDTLTLSADGASLTFLR